MYMYYFLPGPVECLQLLNPVESESSHVNWSSWPDVSPFSDIALWQINL